MKPTVLDVGQCDMDHSSIRGLLEGLGARVLRARDAVEARSLLSSEAVSLVLVNRIFDCDGGEGLSLIRELTRNGKGEREIMLVSNYPEYQAQAVELGALQGFGKAELRKPETAAILKKALGL